MKITLKQAMYISGKIKEIEKNKNSYESLKIRRTLAEYVSKLTDDEWLELKKQFEREEAYY